MLPSASNALLKTLEEPPEDTFIILTSDAPNKLLPTILSRLHPVGMKSDPIAPVDLAPFFALAEKGEWDLFFEKLAELDENEPNEVFQGYLEWVASNRSIKTFNKASYLVEEAQKALQHNLKPRTIYLHLFLTL